MDNERSTERTPSAASAGRQAAVAATLATGAFAVTSRDTVTSARCGILRTAHGDVTTPVFMPVGTQATVKTQTPAHLREAGVTMVLGNAYHLCLRPGEETIGRIGGLHRFMGWDGPILTDSGGFQVFSLARLTEVSNEGVRFRSHIDGNVEFISPERCMQIQESLGADVAMAFDECVAYPCERDRARQAMERTLLWAERSKQAHRRTDQLLFGIVQGSVFRELRLENVERLSELNFPGYAIGGLSVGEGKLLLHEVLSYTVPALPWDRPRYLMGVGTPADILRCVALGVDMFDCVMPTRNARGACAFTFAGKVRLRNRRYADDPAPVADECECYTCQNFSRAYLRHLFNAGEVLGAMLVSLHNVHFYVDLLQRAQEAIADDSFGLFLQQFLSNHKE